MWSEGKRQRERDSHPLALRTHPPARALLSRDIHHGCSSLCPASSGSLLLSALPGPIPPPALSHQCSDLSPGAKEEVGRYLNYQIFELWLFYICSCTAIPWCLPHQALLPSGAQSGVVWIPEHCPGENKRSSQGLL